MAYGIDLQGANCPMYDPFTMSCITEGQFGGKAKRFCSHLFPIFQREELKLSAVGNAGDAMVSADSK